MQTLFILLARAGGVGPISIMPQALLVGVFFLFFTAHQALRNNDENISNILILFFFLAPTVLFCIDSAYASSCVLGMLCGMFYAIGIKNPDKNN